MQFLYFSSRAIGSELDYVSPNLMRRECIGPEAKRGTLYFREQTGATSKCVVNRQLQTWRKTPNSDIWIGYYNDDQPTPIDLARDEMIGGHFVTLGDGGRWRIPVCRQYLPDKEQFAQKLPRTMDIDDNGEWIIGSVVAKHRALWNASEEWWDAIVDGIESGVDSSTVTINDVAESCVSVLSTNYRVGRIEMAMLGLLTDDTRVEIMNASIDMPTFREHLKKKQQQERSATTPGSGAEILSIAQA